MREVLYQCTLLQFYVLCSNLRMFSAPIPSSLFQLKKHLAHKYNSLCQFGWNGCQVHHCSCLVYLTQDHQHWQNSLMSMKQFVKDASTLYLVMFQGSPLADLSSRYITLLLIVPGTRSALLTVQLGVFNIFRYKLFWLVATKMRYFSFVPDQSSCPFGKLYLLFAVQFHRNYCCVWAVTMVAHTS